MSSTVGRAMLADAAQQLMVAWARARESWNDNAAAGYEKKYIEPLGPKVRSTIGAMEKLSDASASARRACGD
ncbi:MAG: hypothetical protein KF757_05170 [Phycisphaeraceae bacterium]|nr:hypothetical protein [Phycisphaeraceae bacterium]MCW5763841.1 hypothetical protein [Phycisphaeraceae bacterium]